LTDPHIRPNGQTDQYSAERQSQEGLIPNKTIRELLEFVLEHLPAMGYNWCGERLSEWVVVLTEQQRDKLDVRLQELIQLGITTLDFHTVVFHCVGNDITRNEGAFVGAQPVFDYAIGE
jgi:hypothetical protein